MPEGDADSSGDVGERYLAFYPAIKQKFGLSRTSAYRLDKTGEIKTVKIRSRKLVAVGELNRFAKELDSRG